MVSKEKAGVLPWQEQFEAVPAVLYFSYRPLISLGASDTMNFELSLPLIWLVMFDTVAMAIMVRRKLLFRDFEKKWAWLMFPGFLTLSLIWSHDVVRGILTVGILWLLYFAIFSFVVLKKEIVDEKFRFSFFKIGIINFLVGVAEECDPYNYLYNLC